MAARSGTLSPISVDSANDWSPVSKYNASDNPYSPSVPPTPRNQLITPPTSVTSSTDGMIANGLARPPTSNGQPSPPSSIARSSTGDGLYTPSIRDPDRDRESVSSSKGRQIEESLAEHYRVLKIYLGNYLRDEKGNLRPNRARDKLLRLSSVQFQELSTDVYDESIRREEERRRGGPNSPKNNVPKYLLPKTNYHPKRNQARQKLSTLPLDRFRQLATDVFYELERRFPHFIAEEDRDRRPGSPTGSIASNRSRGPGRGPIPSSGSMGRGPPPPGYRGPPPGPGGPGYRGPPGPGLGPPGGPGGEFGRPLPRTFQSNTIVPNKGTMVEDDDDNSGADEDDEDDAFGLEDAARSSKRTTNRSMANDKAIADLTEQVEQLQEKAEGLENQVKEKEEEIEKLKSAEKSGDDTTDGGKADELERKLEEAQSLNDSLKSELEKARNDASETEKELRAQIENGGGGSGPGGSDDSEWRQRYEQLERDLEEQQQVTDEVRREASQFLLEMRGLSERSNASLEKEEQLMAEITRLEGEVKEWKSRYARSKTQVRHLRQSSTGLTNFTLDASVDGRDGAFVQPDGLVKDVHLTKFQLGIDQLLQTARKSNSDAVLECMKDVVACVRTITADVDSAGSPTSDDGEDSFKTQHKLKSRVSATANNLITASKNHATAQGLAPVSLLDAAASHLTMSVVELVKVVRIRPTQPGEEDYENLDVKSTRLSADYYGNASRHSRNGSNISVESRRYSRSAAGSPRPWSTRRSAGPNGLLNGSSVNIVRESSGLEEVKEYLEDQTTDLVNSIQPLVQEIRSTPAGAPFPPQTEQAIEQHINDINRTVYDIGLKTREAITNTRNSSLSKHATPVVDLLEECREGLLSAQQEDDAGKREKIPPLAFKIARATKELVLRVERIENRELTADMTVSNDF